MVEVFLEVELVDPSCSTDTLPEKGGPYTGIFQDSAGAPCFWAGEGWGGGGLLPQCWVRCADASRGQSPEIVPSLHQVPAHSCAARSWLVSSRRASHHPCHASTATALPLLPTLPPLPSAALLAQPGHVHEACKDPGPERRDGPAARAGRALTLGAASAGLLGSQEGGGGSQPPGGSHRESELESAWQFCEAVNLPSGFSAGSFYCMSCVPQGCLMRMRPFPRPAANGNSRTRPQGSARPRTLG